MRYINVLNLFCPPLGLIYQTLIFFSHSRHICNLFKSNLKRSVNRDNHLAVYLNVCFGANAPLILG